MDSSQAVRISINQLERQHVFAALENALVDWNPPALFITLAFARAAIARGGFAADQRRLTPALHVGWLLHALREESGDGIRALIGRILESIGEQVSEHVGSFGRALVPVLEEGERGRTLETPFEIARRAAHLDGATPKLDDVLVALNCFLCSEPMLGAHVRTGTVLAKWDRDSKDAPEFWICATPACDMVPRPPSKRANTRWSDDLSPLRPMTVVRAAKVNTLTAAKRAEQGRYAFFEFEGEPTAVELITATEREARLEVMFAEDLARVNASDNSLYVYRLRVTCGAPVLERVKLTAIAQMQAGYASRLLQNAGVQQSRIGVDFVSPPPAEEKD